MERQAAYWGNEMRKGRGVQKCLGEGDESEERERALHLLVKCGRQVLVRGLTIVINKCIHHVVRNQCSFVPGLGKV